MTWTVSDIPDQTGRVVVVTGGNGGLGLEVVRGLARAGALVIVAARDREKAGGALGAVREELPDAAIELRQLDLADLGSVRACAAGITRDHRVIDVLVNNAGVMAVPERRTADGFELQLAVNHLGHFVLTGRLLPALLSAHSARVVSVTSFARFVARRVDPHDPHLRAGYDPWRAYSRSKLANLQFAVELQRRLAGAGATTRSVAADPGLSRTDLQARSVRDSGGGPAQRFWHGAARLVGTSAAQGAQPLLRAAADTHARGGELYAPRYGTFGPPVRRRLVGRSASAAHGRLLWEVSERETGERVDVPQLVRDGHQLPPDFS